LATNLGAIEHDSYALFKNIPLAQVSGMTVRVASGGSGCRMALRQGSKEGPVLAAFQVKPTGGYNEFVELTSEWTASDQRSDVFITFENPGKGGLMDLDWVRFNQ
jgi:cytochrome c